MSHVHMLGFFFFRFNTSVFVGYCVVDQDWITGVVRAGMF